jgi:uncharacterized protein (DUF2147 family)
MQISGKYFRRFLMTAVFGLFAMCQIFPALAMRVVAEQNDSPVGYWKTIDDVSGKPKSIVWITRNENQELAGQIIRIFPDSPAQGVDKLCRACKGALHNMPIVGMVILSGLKPDVRQWKNGKILDPHNGKTYSCSLRLVDHGKKLRIHGYIGIPLFGRSQTWERVDLMSG